jgi:hypothetical protein
MHWFGCLQRLSERNTTKSLAFVQAVLQTSKAKCVNLTGTAAINIRYLLSQASQWPDGGQSLAFLPQFQQPDSQAMSDNTSIPH